MGGSTMSRGRRLAAVTVLTVVLVAGLAGCGSDDSQSDGSGTPPTASTAAPAQPAATDAPSTGQAGEAAQLEDGRHPVLLERVDLAGRTVTVDLVQWFTGEAATKAAAEDGEESPPPNDYYVRNVNPRLRTLPVASGARLTLTRQTSARAATPPRVLRSTWPGSLPAAASTCSGPPCGAVGSCGWSSTSPDRTSFRLPAVGPQAWVDLYSGAMRRANCGSQTRSWMTPSSRGAVARRLASSSGVALASTQGTAMRMCR
jgi:hypothetical protein